MLLESQSQGRIEVICGSMFSGKTEELIRRIKRAQFAQMSIKCFKPTIDTRYHESDVVSHDKSAIASMTVEHSSSIIPLSEGVQVVAIDEAQFFDDQLPEVCNTLANKGIRVIVAGLDMDFQGKPFGPIPNLLAIAEHVTKVHAICVKTGDLANFSFRKSAENDLVQLGETHNYMPLSRKAFIEAMKTRNNESI